MRMLSTVLLSLAVQGSAAAAAPCPPAPMSRAQLLGLEAAKFEVADDAQRQAMALGLLGCMADPDPALREGAAFPALASWLRADKLDPATLRSMRVSQLAALKQPDAAGFSQAFAVLVLAELVRADRIKPAMSSAERGEILQEGTAYLSALRDYRGYDAKQGWRHAVAHAADLMRELARHPGLSKQDQQQVLAAVATQLNSAGRQEPPHFYHFFEGDRLGVPVYYLAARGDISAAEWEAWFASLAIPKADLDGASSLSAMARYHNLKGFLMPLYIALIQSKDVAQRERLLPHVEQAYKIK